MKKFMVSIVVVFSLLLSFPYISYAQIKEDSFQLHTLDSVSGFFDDSTLQTYQNNITAFDDDSKITSIYDAINSFSLTGYKPMLYGYIYSGSTLRLFVYAVSDIVTDVSYFCYGNVSQDISFSGLIQLAYDNSSSMPNGYVIIGQPCEYNFSTQSWNYSSTYTTTLYGYIDGRKAIAYIGSSNNGFCLLDANCVVYSAYQYENNGGSNLNTSSDLFSIDTSSLTDFMSDNLPYNDSDGNIINPDSGVEIESNSNHMYFKSCDLGFCEPYGVIDFSNFGGAYLYAKYTVDDWIVNHINEYSLQFNVVSVIGQRQNSFSYTARLDRNGIVTVPFSSIFVSNSPSAIPKNNSFVACVSSQKLNSDYNIASLYTLSESNLTNWLNATKSYTTFSFSGLGWAALQGKEIQYIVACINDAGTHSLNDGRNANTLVQINPYILRVSVRLIDSEMNQSGEYSEKFDLFTGDASTVNSDGLVNHDPFIPDVIPDDPDSLPIVPDDKGNSTTPVTIINNGGTWTGSGIISYDPGYRELRDDVINSENDWGQYFLPFKDSNGVGEMFGSFLDNMPVELKVIFIGGFGVLTCFAIYRFIRRG